MTKKILAMFLAVLMIVSVLPASVLAADSDCPIEAGKHNLDNCTAYSVKKVVAATCATAGYTLYECDACGDTFIGSATAALGHDPEAETVTKVADLVEPTFTEVGYAAKYHCSVCNKDFGGEEIAVYTDETLFECEEGGNCALKAEGIACSTNGLVHTCVKCGFTVVSRASHEINYEKITIVTEPTETANGEATAPCDECGETASIVIYPNHDHTVSQYEGDDRYTLEQVAEVKNCVTGGTVAHLQCVICEKRFLNENGVLVEKTLAELAGKPEKPAKHTVPTDDTIDKEATCTVDGKNTYECSVCGVKVEEIIPAGHLYGDAGTEVVVKMDCGQDGITVLTCQREGCGLVSTVTEPATQHSTLEEYLAAIEAIGDSTSVEDEAAYHKNCYNGTTGFLKKVYNNATCTKDGTYTWWCLHCGTPRTAASEKTGHSIASFTVPATCAAVSYTFNYCTNNCDDYTAAGIVKDTAGKEYAAYVTYQQVSIEAVEDEDGNVIGYKQTTEELINDSPCVHGTIVSFGTEKDSTKHRYTYETKVEPTCTTAGTYYSLCADCGYENKRNPAATGHDWVTSATYSVESKRPVTVASTCATQGTVTYYCKAENCTETKIEYLPLVTDLVYTSLTQAYADHGIYEESVTDGLKWTAHQDGTCTQYGFEQYYCSACEHNVIVTDGQSGKGHSDSKVFTITAAGTTELYNFDNGGYRITVTATSGEKTIDSGKLPVAITVFGATIENFGEEVQVNAYYASSFVELSALHFASAEDAEVEYEFDSYIITVKYYTHTEPTCTTKGEVNAHNCINSYCDTDLTTEDAQVYTYAATEIAALGHNYVTLKEAVSGVCGEPSSKALIMCSRCNDIKDEKINGTTVANYYDGKIIVSVTEGWDIDEAICKNEEPLYDLYYCEDCETYHIRNYKPVVPHTWNKGEVTDEATCGTPGTKLYTCTVVGCGATKTEEIPATAHKNAAGEFFTNHCNDTETDRHCVVCCTCGTTHDCTKQKNSDASYKCACMIGKKHSATVSKTDDLYCKPTCTDKGYWVAICEYCDEAQVILNEDSKALGHTAPDYTTSGLSEADAILYAEKYTEVDGKAYLEYVAPEIGVAGLAHYECVTCGADIKLEIPALKNLQFYLEASNADAPACDEFATLSLVALTVKVTGIDATLAGFSMNIAVDGLASYVGYAWAENTPFLGSVTEPVAYYDSDDEGMITILGRVIGTTEIAVEDEALLTLYFRVFDDTEFSISDAIAQNAVETVECSAVGTEIEVLMLGDVNGDEKDGAEAILNDLQAAINLLYAEEEAYNVCADFNRNGQIDLQDLQLMCKAAAGNVDLIDMLNLNLHEGEFDLYYAMGICLECKSETDDHSVDCSHYVKA